jgi:hypothetical protein
MADSEAHSSADSGEGLGFALENVDKLTAEIGNAGLFDRTDIHDPQEQLESKREKIESEHEGLRGALGSVYSKLGRQPSYQSEMNELSDAQRQYAEGETKGAEKLNQQQEHNRLQQLRGQVDSALADENKSDFDRQRGAIDGNYSAQLEAAKQVADGRTFQSQGFKSQAEANAYAQHLKEAAGQIHNTENNKLWMAREGQLTAGQERIGALNQIAAGDGAGAAPRWKTSLIPKIWR